MWTVLLPHDPHRKGISLEIVGNELQIMTLSDGSVEADLDKHEKFVRVVMAAFKALHGKAHELGLISEFNGILMREPEMTIFEDACRAAVEYLKRNFQVEKKSEE